MSLASLLMPEGEFRVIRCEIADKLIQCGDGDAALLYLYIIRHGNRFQEAQAMRDLRLPKERFERAVFTLTNLAIAQSPTATEITPSPAPRYTASELRAARADDHRFRAVCDTAESILGRPLTDALQRTLYTVYNHIGLPAEVIIELLSYLGRDKGAIKGRDIEREACIWSDKGILTTADAQRYLSEVEAEKPLRDALFQTLGVVGRAPTAAERSLIALCLEKGFPPDALQLAIQRMKRGIGQFSASYLRKMLSSWDQKGVHTVAEITALEPESIRKNQPTAPVTEPPFGNAAAPAAGSAQPAQLADWEKEWLEEVKRRRAAREEG